MFFHVAFLDLIFMHAMLMFGGIMRLLDTPRDSLGAKTARGLASRQQSAAPRQIVQCAFSLEAGIKPVGTLPLHVF